MLQPIFEELKQSLEKSINHASNELAKIRAGKAMPNMLDSVMVDYYGSHMPLNQVANVNTPDARTLVIQPWEKSMIEPIEKAIKEANLGLNPQNDGTVVRINVPALTEERRKQLVKNVKHEGEQAKIAIRNIRKDINEKIKKLLKDGLPEDEAKLGEGKVQNQVDSYISKVDDLVLQKEKEIMTV